MIAYIPLFFVLMFRLKKAYPDTFRKERVKVDVLFSIGMIIFILRLFIYFCLQYADFEFLNIEKLSSEIPFYVSELIIAFSFMFFMIKVHSNT